MNIINLLLDSFSQELIKMISGELLSDAQIRAIVNHSVGKYFKQLFPKIGEEREIADCVDEARQYISKIGELIVQLQDKLNAQAQQLELSLEKYKKIKSLSDQHQALAKIGREQSQALRSEIEEAMREQLLAASKKGKKVRQIVWLLTLILSAGLGAYFKDIIAFFFP